MRAFQTISENDGRDRFAIACSCIAGVGRKMNTHRYLQIGISSISKSIAIGPDAQRFWMRADMQAAPRDFVAAAAELKLARMLPIDEKTIRLIQKTKKRIEFA